MIISMSIGLMIIAGITTVFISNGKTSNAISSRTERMGDLFIASQLMQAGLRESRKTPDPNNPILTNLSSRSVSIPSGYPASFSFLPYWDATSKTLTYQNLEGNVGIFHYQHKSGGKIQKDKIYWLRPLAKGASGSKNFQELIRNLDTKKGMIVSPVSGGVTVKLKSIYSNEHEPLSLSFSIWPRN